MTSDIPVGLDVEFELTRFVRRVRARGLGRLESVHPQLDYGTFAFLLAICDAPHGVRGSELAEGFGVHKSTASRAISTLEKFGMISRIPDPDDGRAQLLVPEPETQRKVAEYRRTAHERVVAMLADWTPEEINAFARSLTRLNDHIESER